MQMRTVRRTSVGIAAALLFLLLAAAPVWSQDSATTNLLGDEFGWTQFGVIVLALSIGFSPLRVLPPFVAVTAAMHQDQARKVALRGIGIALLLGLIAAVLGQFILRRWGITVPALRIAAALVLFVISLRNILSQYWTGAQAQKAVLAAATSAKRADPALSPLAFPIFLPPHGLALLMLMLAIGPTLSSDLVVYGAFGVMMLVNLFFLWHARAILNRGGAVLGVLGAVASVLLVALSTQVFVEGLQGLLLLF